MYVFFAIVLLVMGFVMIRFPDFVYELTEGWKSNRPGEPSGLYRFSTRFGGVMCMLAGICGLCVPFLR